MGMREGGIQDFQLTASSAVLGNLPHHGRPHGVGWCAQLNDSIPYLQVICYLEYCALLACDVVINVLA